MVGPGMAFTMFRPKDLMKRHPVITWGNGTGTTPPTYRTLLDLYASHGFIVIASNSMNVAQGTPPPMLDGVTWVLEQDTTMGSPLFGHVDRDHIGATAASLNLFVAGPAVAGQVCDQVLRKFAFRVVRDVPTSACPPGTISAMLPRILR